jgi:ParB family transcriptional regulator, chromosome partitioning protein
MKDFSKSMFGVSAHIKRITEVELAKIDRNPEQPRKTFDQQALEELAASIKEVGLLQPIIVRKGGEGRYVLVAGERRHRAVELLEWSSMDAIVIEGENADEISLIENLQRENLRPIEEAEAVDRLIKLHEYKQEDAAKILGKSRSSITELLGLLRLPDIIRDGSRLADIPKSTLLAIARIGDEAEQLAAFEAAKSGNVSVRTAKSIQKGETTVKEHGDGAARPQDHVKHATRAIYAAIDRLGHVEGVPDKKALVALKEAKRKLDELYKEVTSRKGSVVEAQQVASE